MFALRNTCGVHGAFEGYLTRECRSKRLLGLQCGNVLLDHLLKLAFVWRRLRFSKDSLMKARNRALPKRALYSDLYASQSVAIQKGFRAENHSATMKTRTSFSPPPSTLSVRHRAALRGERKRDPPLKTARAFFAGALRIRRSRQVKPAPWSVDLQLHTFISRDCEPGVPTATEQSSARWAPMKWRVAFDSSPSSKGPLAYFVHELDCHGAMEDAKASRIT